MSYPKANLGAIVLPIPDDEYNFSDYKEEYGIDLDEILDSSRSYAPRLSISKLILLQDIDSNYAFTQIREMNVIDVSVEEDGDLFTYLGYAIVYKDGSIAITRGIKIAIADRVVQPFYNEI